MMLRSGSLQFVFSIFLAIIQLIMLRLMHKYLNAFELGLYSLAMMLIFLLQSFCDMGISSFSINSNNDNYYFNNKLHKLSLLLGFFSFVLGVLGTFILANIYNADVFIFHGFLLSLSFPFLTLTGYYQSIMVRKKKLVAIAIYDFLSRALSLILLYFMFVIGGRFDAFIYSYLVYAVIRCCLYFVTSNNLVTFISFRVYPSEDGHDENISYRNFFSFMIFQFLGQFVNSISVKVDEMVLGRVLGLELLGIYTLVKNYVVQVGYLVIPLVRRISLSILVEKSDQNNNYIKLSYFFSYLLVAYFLGGAIVSKLMLNIVFGNNISEYLPVFIIMLITWAVRVAGGSVLSSYFVVKGKPNYDFYWNLLQGSIIACVAIFTEYKNLQDLAVHIFIAYSLYVIIAAPVFCYLLKSEWSKSFFTNFVVISICGIIVINRNLLISLTITESMGVIFIYGLLFCLLSYFFVRKHII
ncbi:oligosaccharide flippase family protein [Escherichia coli]